MNKWLKSLKAFTLFSVLVAVIPGCIADSESLNRQLVSISSIVSNATTIEIARLKPIGVEAAESKSLQSVNHIAGFPINGKLTPLDPITSTELIKSVLNSNNYINVRQRCSNKYLLGIRFSKNTQIAEFSLGLPCEQAVWAFKADGKTERWGSVIRQDVANEIIKYFSGI